jgi:hypothetical protein
LGSIQTLKISGLILRHKLLFPPSPNFQRGNLLNKLVSSTNLDHFCSVALFLPECQIAGVRLKIRTFQIVPRKLKRLTLFDS